jgi:2-amino-4-hydroxy-6-hydroxymethyldihydropteridine diphosphokinase
MRAPVLSYVGLGSNLGASAETILRAVEALDRLPSSAVRARSQLYRSAPVGASGPDYVNAVVALDTRLTAPDLLEELLRVELDFGRVRPYPNAPRTLDLDLLLYGHAHVQSSRLVVPHPRMHLRAFVLRPLAELAPDRVPAAWLSETAAQAVTLLTETACALPRSETRNSAGS